jgi:hypothetical protein
MRTLLVLALLAVPALARADKTFSKGKGETWDCAKDPVVRIVMSKGTFGFIGECKRISVTGSKNVLSVASVGKIAITGADNMVDIEEVDAIAVSGARNHVSWQKAKTGDKPKVAKSGSGNSVDVKK